MILVEAELDVRKTALFELTAERPHIGEIHSITRLMAHLERLDGATLAEEYRRHRELYPHIAGPLVAWAQLREAAERAAVERYIREMA